MFPKCQSFSRFYGFVFCLFVFLPLPHVIYYIPYSLKQLPFLTYTKAELYITTTNRKLGPYPLYKRLKRRKEKDEKQKCL